jgi:hypothetical protein
VATDNKPKAYEQPVAEIPKEFAPLVNAVNMHYAGRSIRIRGAPDDGDPEVGFALAGGRRVARRAHREAAF